MTKEQIESTVTFKLSQSNLKDKKDFTVVAKIGGGKKIVEVNFKSKALLEKHKTDLEQFANNNRLELKLKVAA